MSFKLQWPKMLFFEWNKIQTKSKSGHPCLVPDFRGNAFGFPQLSMMLAVGLSYMAFIMLRYIPSMPTFWRVFIIGCWILSRAFFLLFWDDHMVFILGFVNVVYYTDWIVNMEKSLYPWNKSHSIMVYDPFNVFLDWFTNILLKIFESMFISDIGLFLWNHCLVLESGWCWPHRMSL